VSLFVAVAAVGMLVVVGLVVDGGGKVRALQEADAVAGEAARHGGQAIVAGPAIRGQDPVVDTPAAIAAAEQYLAAAGVPGSVDVVGGTRLRVTTTTSYTPVFMSVIGVGPMRVAGEGEVRLVRGLDGEIP
jgi:hypothetical protein